MNNSISGFLENIQHKINSLFPFIWLYYLIGTFKTTLWKTPCLNINYSSISLTEILDTLAMSSPLGLSTEVC